MKILGNFPRRSAHTNSLNDKSPPNEGNRVANSKVLKRQQIKLIKFPCHRFQLSRKLALLVFPERGPITSPVSCKEAAFRTTLNN